MGRFEIALILWAIGIALSVATGTFVLWQLGWVSILSCFNLELLSAWCIFAAALCGFNGRPAPGTALIGIAAVPLFTALALGRLMDDLIVVSGTGQLVLGVAVILLFAGIGTWGCLADVAGAQRKKEVALSEPQRA